MSHCLRFQHSFALTMRLRDEWGYLWKRQLSFSHCTFVLIICVFSFTFAAVRADRMRGGRNKFGPMYKRDRARKLQILRQRQLALQAIRGSIGGGSSSSGTAPDGAQSQLSPTGYPPYTNMHIKQEIQIPQVRKRRLAPNLCSLEYFPFQRSHHWRHRLIHHQVLC